MSKLAELEKKYKELGEEIEKLKGEQLIDSDPVFLLSVEEYEKYKDKVPSFDCWWWLRSPGRYQAYAAHVLYGGSVIYYGSSVNRDDVCVRPALRKQPLIFYKPVDENRIIYCGVTWVKIDDGLYIAEVPIATHRFDAKSNNYETSEIRRFLLDWYNKRKNW